MTSIKLDTVFISLSLLSYWSWWRHHTETFSALLAICAGNSPAIGEFPAQRPVTRSFYVFFDLRPNKRLSKQSRAGDLRHHCAYYDVTVMVNAGTSQEWLKFSLYIHDIYDHTFPSLLLLTVVTLLMIHDIIPIVSRFACWHWSNRMSESDHDFTKIYDQAQARS